MSKTVFSFLFVIIFYFLLQGCNNHKKNNVSIAKEEIINADEAFSNMSRKQGMKKAFLEFIDNDGILLRPGRLPIVGADAIDFLSQTNDTSYTLTWKPFAAEASSSGDLGFTYGVYSLMLPDTTLSGTYVSIWKKQPDGKWKFILDSGNAGTKSEKTPE
jgi:ketosteroid isomerase-like protein